MKFPLGTMPRRHTGIMEVKVCAFLTKNRDEWLVFDISTTPSPKTDTGPQRT
jgi:hypothetical protein